MSVTTEINVRELFEQEAPLTGEQIEELQIAISNHQFHEVRQEIQNLEDRLSSGGGTVPQLQRIGVAAHLVGRHDTAAEYLLRAKADALSAYYLAETLLSQERFTEAISQYDVAEKNGYDKVDCRLKQAGAVRALGKLDEAEALVRSSAPQGATRAEYSYQMGCILADRGDTFGAVEYFERAVDMDPYHSKALFSLARQNCLYGNDDEAIRLYERSLSRPPILLGALMNLGLLYEDTDNMSAAAYCFRRVLDAQPTHARARLYLKDIEAADSMYYDEDQQRNQTRMNQVLQTPVTDFELSVRSRNCLQKMGVRNLGDLTRTSEAELLAGKNFGETSLHEIKFMLESRGLALGQSVQKEKPRDTGYRSESLSPQEQALLGRPVADLNLSVRARKCMSRLGISSLSELCSRTPDELLESKNFGVTSLNEVRSKLTDLGLKLRND